MNPKSLNILSFPLWWYTTGFSLCRKWCANKFRYALQKTAIVLFARHLGEPFYGDATTVGRVISVPLRLAVLFIKAGALLVRSLIIAAAFLLYVFALPLAVWMIIYQLIPIK